LVVFMDDGWAALSAELRGRFLAHPLRMGSKKLVWAEFPVPAGGVQEPINFGARNVRSGAGR